MCARLAKLAPWTRGAVLSRISISACPKIRFIQASRSRLIYSGLESTTRDGSFWLQHQTPNCNSLQIPRFHLAPSTQDRCEIQMLVGLLDYKLRKHLATLGSLGCVPVSRLSEQWGFSAWRTQEATAFGMFQCQAPLPLSSPATQFHR